MHRLALTLCALIALSGLCYGGPEPISGKDKEIQLTPPPCDWYRAHEWDLAIWAAWAFTDNNRHTLDFDYETVDELFDESLKPVFLGDPQDDHFLNRSSAWGGGGDLKYFWSKYFGAGVEGFVLDAKQNVAGAVLATFTVRYPIGCSRFAPYAFGGIGVAAGGSHSERYFFEHHNPDENNEEELVKDRIITDKHARFIGQVGTGMEVRLTRPSTESKVVFGLMADISWNFVADAEGDHSDFGNRNDAHHTDGDADFGMGRFGLAMSY